MNFYRPGLNFGTVPCEKEINISYEVLNKQSVDDENFLDAVCNTLKIGKFYEKKHLKSIICSSNKKAVKNTAIRLFCCVATHEDFDWLFDALPMFTYDEVRSFVMYAPHSLSIEVIPFMLALLESEPGAEMSQCILESINRICGFSVDASKGVNSELVGALFVDFSKKIDQKSYLFRGVDAFAGDLARSFLLRVSQAKYECSQLLLADEPSMLSVWSGLECPAHYFSVVSEKEYVESYQYIKEISTLKWGKGHKYFYGFDVESGERIHLR